MKTAIVNLGVIVTGDWRDPDNPYAGRFSEDLSQLVDNSSGLGAEFGRRIVTALSGDRAESYGKACIVGTEGESEHGNALLTTAFVTCADAPAPREIVVIFAVAARGRLHARLGGLRVLT